MMPWLVGQSLETYLLFSSMYAVVMGSAIAVMAFPYEKEMRTIEYLFSLPLKDSEIFAGKALAAIAGRAGRADLRHGHDQRLRAGPQRAPDPVDDAVPGHYHCC